MTEEASSEDPTASAVVDLTVLASEVVAAVTGPRGPEPSRSAVRDALRRRAEGAPYAEIASAIDGVSEKRAASWCRAAARIDPRFDAREAKPRRARKGAQRPELDKLIGWRPRHGTRAALQRRSEVEGRSITVIVQAAVDAYLQRRTAGVEVLVREQLRKGLKEELRAVAKSVGDQRMELARQGNNFNQLVKFTNRYKELPVSVTGEMQQLRAALDANSAELARLRASVEALVER
ncbi:hypothetical protein [Gordonia jinhuaensis]|uniref:Mobilisation protein (MobC) n=1 Tax=Gordonia jinhuaensis TaxID=1517702 RepID=A0A916SUY9_9ACTN|nr:hypothetical protein [Gordonia jinhuaensis]GGB18298.1 hypothetical protein GCM10011489_02960 [Gordonia jinhuaensis]